METIMTGKEIEILKSRGQVLINRKYTGLHLKRLRNANTAGIEVILHGTNYVEAVVEYTQTSQGCLHRFYLAD